MAGEYVASATREEERPPAGGAAENLPPPAKEKPVQRKIIYTATIDLVVEDFDKAEADLLKLRDEQGGYTARSEVRGTPGTPRNGNWTLRIPVKNFDAFMAIVVKLGDLRRNALESNDVTAKYIDVEARMKTNEVREEGLRKLFQKFSSEGNAKELVHIDDKLSEVRGTIESQKSALKQWDTDVAYATVNVTIWDRRDYVPPTRPTFDTTVARTFQGSVDALLAFGKFLVLAVVAVTPWLPIPLLLVGLVWWRRRPRVSTGG